MEITAAQVKKLRDQTGAGMMECKAALTEAKGNLDDATTILRKRGLAQASKKAGRSTNEGLIGEIRFGKDANLYDRKLTPHDHAICTKCGELVDIEMEHPAELVNKAAAYSGFQPESLEFTLRGKCPDCVKN